VHVYLPVDVSNCSVGAKSVCPLFGGFVVSPRQYQQGRTSAPAPSLFWRVESHPHVVSQQLAANVMETDRI